MARAPVLAAGGIVLRPEQTPLIAVVRLRKRNEWVLPKGKLDDGETPLTAAKRELLEETGYRARQWKRILHFYVSPGFLDETMTIYLASGLKAGTAPPEADEKIAVRFFGLPEAKRRALQGRIRDAKTIAGILWLAQMPRGAR